MRDRIFVCFIFLAIIPACSPSPAADETSLLTPLPVQQTMPPGYTEYQSVPVNVPEAGMTGFLQILQDNRVTPAYRRTWGLSANPEMPLGPNDPLVAKVKHDPLRNGLLRQTNNEGRILSVYALGEPLAEIKTDFLYGTKFPTYFLSVDYGIGMGSYAGPATTLIEIHDGRLVEMPIVLGETLKSGWRIVPAYSGVGKEIEVVQCHPNFINPHWADTGEFAIVYSVYRFANGRWNKSSVEKKGIWESDDGWPQRSAFP
jgi:hypothetical protein